MREGELDAQRFETLVAEARQSLAAGEADQAGAVVRQALGLWRGGPLADPRRRAVRDRRDRPAQEQRRLSAIELRDEADLAVDGAPGPAPAPGRRRRPAIAAAVVLLAVAAVTVAVLVVGGGDDAPESVSVAVDSVAVIDPSTNTVTHALHVDEAPGPIVSGAGLLWVLNLNSETVSRIDPRQARVLRTQGIGNSPGNVTGSVQEVWILTGCTVGAPGELQHLYTARDGGVDMLGGGVVSLAGAVPGPRPPGVPSSTGCGLASRGSTVWAATNIEPGLARVDNDPASLQGRVNWGTPLPQAPPAIAVGAGALWALDAANEVVRRIDAKTGHVVAEVRAGSDPVAVAAGAGSVWVANRGDDSVSRVDPHTNAVSKAISVGDGPLAVAAGTDAVWVSTSDGVVAKIDPRTDKVTARISVGHRSEGIALAAGRVWVTVRG